MDNSAFIERFKELLEDNKLTASALADEIEVQRSSISHILSGRNKPSLDFVLKLVKRFPDINIYWLLNGVENKVKMSGSSIEKTKEKVNSIEKPQDLSLPLSSNNSKTVKNIVVFYNDGTFEQFTPN